MESYTIPETIRNSYGEVSRVEIGFDIIIR